MASRSESGGASAKQGTARYLVWLVIGLFFIWGGTTSLNDVLIPKLKGLYSLTYAEVMLTQFAFFTGYFVFALPAGALISRIGYLRGVVIGLVIMAAGAALFWPLSLAGMYWPYLRRAVRDRGRHYLPPGRREPADRGAGRRTHGVEPADLCAGVQLARHDDLAMGRLEPDPRRWPRGKTDPATLSGAALSQYRTTESHIVSTVYIGIALVLLLLAAIFWWQRNAVRDEKPAAVGLTDALALLRHRRVAFGVAALFAYVGAEVAIGSMLVNYLQQPAVMGLTAESAGKHLSYYWGAAMVGRFIGAGLLRRVEPGRLLIVFSAINIALIATSMSTTGDVAGWSLIVVGLFNSIMFPTVFALALQGLGERTAEGAGLLCMAIVGGAIIPLATGHLADMTTLSGALVLPLLCYLVIAAFGFFEPNKE